MAGPYLRGGRIPQYDTGEGWARGITQAASGIARGIEKSQALRREEETRFIKSMDKDLSDVTNRTMRGYAADQWDTVRERWVNVWNEKKGRLSVEDKLQLQSDLSDFQKEVEFLNGVSAMNTAAMTAAQKNPKYTYDLEGFTQAMNLFHPKDGKYDQTKIREAFSEWMATDSGLPGVYLTPMNPDDAIISLSPDYRKENKREVGTGIEQKTIKGEPWETPYTDIGYGTNQEATDWLMNRLQKTEFDKNIDKGVSSMLTDEQKVMAAQKYGTDPGAMAKYYYTDVNPDAMNAMTEQSRDFGTIKRRKDSEGGAGTSMKNIKETDVGWNYGTSPVPISRDLKVVDDATGEEMTVKNGTNIGVIKEDGQYFAKIIVPKGKFEGLYQIFTNEQKEKGSELTEDEKQNILKAALVTDRYKVIKVPLEDIYEELKLGFKNKKMIVEGYDDIDFGKKGEYVIGDRSFSEKEMLSMYKTKYPEKSEEELLNAIKKQFGK